MKKYILCIAATLIFFHPVSAALGAAKDEDRVAKLVEGAKKEGQLVYYSSMDITNVQQIVRAFQEKYPFIKVDIVRTGSEGILTRVLAEANAKKLKADVIQSSTPHIHTYRTRNLMLKYLSPEAAAFPESAIDPDGYWVSFYDNVYAVAYNTKLVAPRDVPKSLEDLLLPRWKGKMALDSKDARWYGTIDQVWGSKKTLDYMTKLARQDLVLRSGKTLIIQLLGAGEFDLAITAYLDTVAEFKTKGAAMDWTYLDPVLVSGHPIWIPVTTPHINSATLFVDFLLSEKGQEVISALGKFPPRSTANTERILAKYYPGLDKRPIPKKKYDMPPAVAERYAEYSNQFRSVFVKGK